MKKRFWGFITGALLALGLVFSPVSASAATLVLDNDATSSAPGINDFSGNWVYKTGAGLNGDYRAIGGANAKFANYVWFFTTATTASEYYAYLSTSAATNTRTAYQFGETKYTYINQYAAPSGYIYLGRNEARNKLATINGALSLQNNVIVADAIKVTY